MEQAIFGAGCFWCTEAVFQRLKGVITVEPGYAGGTVANPSYRKVCSGKTGHAEVARITFDPGIITYGDLLTVFWHMHDPTTLNRQGADVGTQYRSVIFYTTESQRKESVSSRDETEKSHLWDNPIITEIKPLETFYPAENYHQNYFNDNSQAPYCSFVIAPKIQKLEKEFGHLLKGSVERN